MDLTPLAGTSPGYSYLAGAPSAAQGPAPAMGATASASATGTQAADTAGAATGTPAASGDPVALAADRALAKEMDNRFTEACRTCKNRRYQDGSTDPGVSFKTPQNIDPSVSASAVMAHEQEHVTNEQAKARQEGGEVVSQNVVLHGDICPECGRYYIAGGTTTTVTRHGGRQAASQQAAPENGGLDITA